MSIVKPLSPPFGVQGTFTQRGPKGRKGRVEMDGWMGVLLYFTRFIFFYLECAIIKNISDKQLLLFILDQFIERAYFFFL